MGFERTVEWRGETLTAMEWSGRTGIPFKVLVARLNAGWMAERALTMAVRGWKKHMDREAEKAAKKEAEQYERDDDRGHRKAIIDTEWGDQGAML